MIVSVFEASFVLWKFIKKNYHLNVLQSHCALHLKWVKNVIKRFFKKTKNKSSPWDPASLLVKAGISGGGGSSSEALPPRSGT